MSGGKSKVCYESPLCLLPSLVFCLVFYLQGVSRNMQHIVFGASTFQFSACAWTESDAKFHWSSLLISKWNSKEVPAWCASSRCREWNQLLQTYTWPVCRDSLLLWNCVDSIWGFLVPSPTQEIHGKELSEEDQGHMQTRTTSWANKEIRV